MFEDRFVDTLQHYPNAVSDRKRFFGLMRDIFPEQQMQVNLINIAYDLGIVDELVKTNHISSAFAFRFVKRLTDEYGVSRVNADWAISVWCVCYGKQILGKPCDFEISKAKTGSTPAIQDEHESGGRQYNDLFRYRSVSDGYGISGFSSGNQRTLIIPNSHNGKPVTRILSGVFENSEVQEVVMTDGIKVIENAAFQSCKNLKQVILPVTLREIGDHAFAGCVSLTTAALPRALEQIGNYAFSGAALKAADIPDSILWIGEGAFQGCSKMTALHLPAQMVNIPDGVFKGCALIRKLVLPDSLLSIGSEAFAGCASMLDLIVPESVTKVGDNAFSGMNDSFRLICCQNSAAEQYARKHNMPFQIVL